MPGRRTLPVTSTTTFRDPALAVADPGPVEEPAGVASAPRGVLRALGAATSCPALRTSHQQVSASPTAATTATTAS
jgi:hypothetical protein